MSEKRAASRWETHHEIANDRDLLDALGLSDAHVSSFLGKSRQTLINQLGPKRGANAPVAYFKPGELHVLVTAARKISTTFDDAAKRAVVDHVEATRGRSPDPALALLMDSLVGTQEAPIEGAKGIVLMVPDFLGLMADQPAVLHRLAGIASEVGALAEEPWVVLLSSHNYQAKMAAERLGFDGARVHAVSHDYVEHYVPMVLIYDEVSPDAQPKPFIVSDLGALFPAPQYRGRMMNNCLRMMLPGEIKSELFKGSDVAADAQAA